MALCARLPFRARCSSRRLSICVQATSTAAARQTRLEEINADIARLDATSHLIAGQQVEKIKTLGEVKARHVLDVPAPEVAQSRALTRLRRYFFTLSPSDASQGAIANLLRRLDPMHQKVEGRDVYDMNKV